MTDEMHFDLDNLADFAEGLLEEGDTERVRAHLTACAECSRMLAEVGAVTEVLASVPAPVMPVDVASRLDAAIEEERAGGSLAGAETPVRTGRARHARKRRGRWLTSLSAAAAAVVVIGGGAAIVSTVMQDGGGNSEAGGAPAPAEQETTSTGPLSSQGDPKAQDAAKPWARHKTNQKYTKENLPEGVEQLVGAGLRTAEGAANDLVDRCAGNLKPKHGDPVAVDKATYEGEPAIILVYRQGDKHYRAVVMDGECDAQLAARDDIPKP